MKKSAAEKTKLLQGPGGNRYSSFQPKSQKETELQDFAPDKNSELLSKLERERENILRIRDFYLKEINDLQEEIKAFQANKPTLTDNDREKNNEILVLRSSKFDELLGKGVKVNLIITDCRTRIEQLDLKISQFKEAQQTNSLGY